MSYIAHKKRKKY